VTGADSPGDLVYLAPHRWESLAQRPQHLAAALAARGWRVLHVEPVAYSVLGNLRRLVTRRPVAWRGRLTERGANLWSYSPPPGLPLTMASARLNALGHRLVRPGLVRALARLAFRRPALVAGWPLAAPWVGHLGERIAVYDCMDDFPAFPQPARRRRAIEAAEAALAARCDLVVATSEGLRAKWAGRARAVRVVPNGVADTFLAALDGSPALPADMAAIPAPRLLYVGVIDRWLDQGSLIALARRHPDWSLVLVGPVGVPVGELAALPNVHLLGSRPHAALPGYLAASAAGLIPFVVSSLTVAVNPVKLYEYLAAGLPVAATPLPELAQFGDVCHLGASGEAFVRAAERAVAEAGDASRREARRAVARQHTWERRAAEFAALIGG
jgi:glycosyltransferase involved in cell wall biosynthesis